jgi:hypothetical protein
LEASPYDGGMTPQILASMYQRMGFQPVGVSRRGNPVMERPTGGGIQRKMRQGSSQTERKTTVPRPPASRNAFLPATIQRMDTESGNYLNIEIKEPKFQTWTRDVTTINFEDDLELFKQKVTDSNPKIVHVGTYQGTGDHVEVFARTEDGIWVKMDMAGGGSRVIYPAHGPTGRDIEEGDWKIKTGLDLNTLLRKFFEVAKARKFDFIDYNCQRFAGSLMSELADWDGDDFW